MNKINIAIIEKSPLARIALEDTLINAHFNVVINTDSISHLYNKQVKKIIDTPEICLLDTTVKISSLRLLKKHYPEIKIVVYDAIGFSGKRNIPQLENFDAYISKSLKIEQWITVLKKVVSHSDYSAT